jgi:tetratricopeptide (TPR) repeat protein
MALYSIDIDVNYVKDQIKQNRYDIPNRILLAKYYYQDRLYENSFRYTHEILKIDPKNKIAKDLEQKIKFINSLKKVVGKDSLTPSQYLEDIYQSKDFKLFTIAFERAKKIGIKLDDDLYPKALKAYDKTGDQKRAQYLLKDPKLKNNTEVENFTKKYELLKKKDEFYKAQTVKSLKDYIYLLGKNGRKNEQLKVLKNFLKNHPNNLESRILYTKHLLWRGELNEAFKTIYPVRKANLQTKELYANILYDKGDYAHAIYYLPKVANLQKDPKKRYYYLKRAAFAYDKAGKKKKAESIFKRLKRNYPNDKETSRYIATKKREDLLRKAVSFHKKRDFANALNYYLKYYHLTKDPKIAKEIGEIYYFSQKEDRAIPYFYNYLNSYPNDDLIRFHLASSYDKKRSFKKSKLEYEKILSHNPKDLYALTKYRYANALMHTYRDRDWFKARSVLRSLETYLSKKSNPKDRKLLTEVEKLYKIAKGDVRKPRRYKDIVLTETGKKDINPNDAFSFEDIKFDKSPKYNSLLHLQNDPNRLKPNIWIGSTYTSNGKLKVFTPKTGIDNIITYSDVGFGLSIENSQFKDKNYKSKKRYEYDAKTLFLSLKAPHWELSLGLDRFKNFNSFVPVVSLEHSLGSHDLSLEAFKRNGVFVNYSTCMVEKKLDVIHVGLQDKWLMTNLKSLNIGVDLNYFEDKNRNIYATVNYPVYETYLAGLGHKVLLEENLEFNSKPNSCAKPLKKYDASYLKYLLRWKFLKGEIGATLGGGRSFWGKENVFSYGVNANIALSKDSYFDLSCDKSQSSFSVDDLITCNFNLNSFW